MTMPTNSGPFISDGSLRAISASLAPSEAPWLRGASDGRDANLGKWRPSPPSGLGQVGHDAVAGLVAAFEGDFAHDVELAGIAGLGELLLLPLAQPQHAPQRGIDDGDLAAAQVAAGDRRQRAEIRHVAIDGADHRRGLALGLLVLRGDAGEGR